jgi:hypothetical protein
MSVSFFRGTRLVRPISQLEEVRAELKKAKANYRIYFRGPRREFKYDTLKQDAVGFVVYLY